LTDDTWVTLAGQLAGDTSEHVYSWWAHDSVAAIATDGTSYAGVTASIVVNGEYAVFFRRGETAPVQLGTGVAVGMTPDAKYVLTISVASHGGSMTVRPVGPGVPRTLELGGVTPVFTPGQLVNFSSDGRKLAFVGSKNNAGRYAFVMDFAGGTPHAVSGEGATAAVISPDGTKVVVGDAARGMYVVSDAGRQPIAGAPKNDVPLAWSADGSSVLSWDGTLPPRIFSTSVSGGARAVVREVHASDPAGLIYGWLTLSPEGRFYLQRSRRILTTVVYVTP
jgi:hypothetical protein